MTRALPWLVVCAVGCADSTDPEPIVPVDEPPSERVAEPDLTTGGEGAGRVTWRRLNRTEYDNTIRDLTGARLPLAADFR